MRHKKDKRKLNRNSSQRRALLRSLVRSLMIYERIETTLPKAKEAKRLAEKIITLAKNNNLNNKRFVYDIIQDHSLTSRIFNEIAPRFKQRKGGYTRIIPLKTRTGDGAQMSFLSLVEMKVKIPSKVKSKKDIGKVKAKDEIKSTKEIKEEPAEPKKSLPKLPKLERQKETKKKGAGFLKNLRKYLGKTKRPEGRKIP